MSPKLWTIMVFFACINLTVCGLSPSDKKFSKCNIGKQLIHKNQAERVKIVFCAEEINGVPQWQYTDGSSTLGEVFNPAKDCSDIVDHLPEAKDGFYWVSVKSKTKNKVWCDLHTDGGGFMLVAMKDSPVSWTVPSNSTPVAPQGPPHLSSVLGDVKILDFGIQISSDKTFQGTKAHWLYRLKQRRQLGNLFTNDKTTGCTASHPGIGDVMYVKDVLTESIATPSFKCSIFGPHTHPNLGWGRMNYCLRHNCKNGYGVFPGPFPFQYTQFGSFSYSATSASTGTGYNSTAFVGCDHGKCCACFGPKGGKQNYCAPRCSAVNGGTVMKNAFVWFWVRTRMPRRLWKKCMEFKMKNSAGKLEEHYIEPKTGTVYKGSCSDQYKALLNEGTLTVSDKESFGKLPNITGVLSYRKDNKQLYVNEGSKWQALSNEQEVHQIQQEVKSQESTNKLQQNEIQQLQMKIKTQENRLLAQGNIIAKLERKYEGIVNRTNMLHPPETCSALLIQRPSRPSGRYYINPRGLGSSPSFQVLCDMTSKNGVGVTEIGHDSESRTLVDGCEAAGCYKRKINYEHSMKQIVAIMQQSKHCEQFIRYKCYHTVLLYNGSPQGWWVSRQGWKMNYWGGAAVNSGKCACGMTNSCAGGGTCNCDANDSVWREDSGYLTDKNTLPVTELRFGDIGDANELAYLTLGKLRCWG